MPEAVDPAIGQGYGEPVFAVFEWGPGVDAVQYVPGHGGSHVVNLVSEFGPGIRPVYFVGGLPSTLNQTTLAQTHLQQVQHEDVMLQRRRNAIDQDEITSQILTTILL